MATAETQGPSLDIESLGGLHWVGIVATVVTAAIHLLLCVRLFLSGLGVSCVLAGLGFGSGIALLVMNVRRRAVYAVGIPFTLVQIVLWYYVNFVSLGKAFPAEVGTLGAVDKVAQVVLLVVLVALLR